MGSTLEGKNLPLLKEYPFTLSTAGLRRAVGRVSDSQAKGPGFDTRSGHILWLLLPLFQEGQLSVNGESMCTKYWLTTLEL